MARPLRPIVSDDPAVAGIASDLRDLRRVAGLTLRRISERSHYSITTLSDATSGRRLPTWELTRAYVEACGGDIEEWHKRWKAANVGRSGAEQVRTAAAGPASASDPVRAADGGRLEPEHGSSQDAAPEQGTLEPCAQPAEVLLREHPLKRLRRSALTAAPGEPAATADTPAPKLLTSSALAYVVQEEIGNLVREMYEFEKTERRYLLTIALSLLLTAVAITLPGVIIAAVLVALHASAHEVIPAVLGTEMVAMKFFTTIARMVWGHTPRGRREGRSK